MRVKFAALAGAAILPALVFSAPLAAQSITLDPPPIRQPLDENGVDRSSGAIVVPSSSISIGGAEGLSHRRYRVGNGWRHNYLISAEIQQGQQQAAINVGGSRRTFTLNGSVYESDQGAGETIVPNFTTGTHIYTASDGTKIVFKESYVSAGQSYYGPADALGDEIIHPSGKRTELHYDKQYYESQLPNGNWYSIHVVRLQSVTTNTGYELHFDYQSGNPGAPDDWYKIAKVTAINSAVEYCDPDASSCNLSQQWPSLSYSETTSGSDKLESVTDILGREARFRTDASMRLTGVKRPGQTSDGLVVAYDANSRVSSITREDGYQRTYAWLTRLDGNLSSISMDTLGRQRTVITDPETRTVVSDRNALGDTVSYQYDDSRRLTEVTAPEGNRTLYTRDARGRVTEVRRIAKVAGSPADIVTSATYPPLISGTEACASAVTCDLPLTTTDPLGNVTNYTYDQTHGGVTKVALPADADGVRPTTQVVYAPQHATVKNASGTLVQEATAVTKPIKVSRCRTAAICAGSADEQVVTVSYPSAGLASNVQPSSITRAAGDGSLAATTTFAYTIRGETSSIDGPLAGSDDITTYRYDLAGQRVGTIFADPDAGGSTQRPATRTTYNADGQIVRQEQGRVAGLTDNNWSSFYAIQSVATAYNASGRVASVAQVSPSGTDQYSLTQYGYDTAGRLECTAVRMHAPLTTTTLPASACTPMAASGGVEDRITRTVYDTADQVTEVWSGVGTSLEQQSVEAGYNANGTLQWVEDANGNRTRYWYDGFDRAWRVNYPLPGTPHEYSATDYDKITYDAAGQASSRRTREGKTFIYTYDALGRVTNKAVPGRTGLASSHSRDLYYTYDLYGDLTAARFDEPTDEGLDFTYDALGRLTSASTDMDGAVRTLAYQYDAAGRRTRLTHPDGEWFAYLHDRLGRMTAIETQAGMSLVRDTYSPEARLTRRTRDSAAPDDFFNYDVAARLSQVFTDNPDPQWDVTRTYAYDSANAVTIETLDNQAFAWNPQVNTDVAYTADGLNRLIQAGGNTLSYDANGNLASDGLTSYVYDTENRLVEASGQNVAHLRYDPFGRLHELVDQNGGITRFLYDGDALVAEYDGGGALIKRYVHGESAGDDPLVEFGGVGTGRSDAIYLYADRLGSIVYATDYTGAAKQVNAYDEYGLPGASSGIANTGRFRFTGQAWLPELGLYYYKARMYSPGLGRFMQTDPIGYADGLNVYRYASNDPVNFVDPSGNAYKGVGGDEICWQQSNNDGYTYWDGEAWVVVADTYSESCSSLPNDIFYGLIANVSSDISYYGRLAIAATANVVCATPPVVVGVGADLYAGAGGSLQGGVTFDLAKLSIGVNGQAAVGVGGQFSTGPFIGRSDRSSSSVSGGLFGEVGGTAGPVSFAYSETLLGSDPGNTSETISIGKPGLGGHAAVGGQMQMSTPSQEIICPG